MATPHGRGPVVWSVAACGDSSPGPFAVDAAVGPAALPALGGGPAGVRNRVATDSGLVEPARPARTYTA